MLLLPLAAGRLRINYNALADLFNDDAAAATGDEQPDRMEAAAAQVEEVEEGDEDHASKASRRKEGVPLGILDLPQPPALWPFLQVASVWSMPVLTHCAAVVDHQCRVHGHASPGGSRSSLLNPAALADMEGESQSVKVALKRHAAQRAAEQAQERERWVGAACLGGGQVNYSPLCVLLYLLYAWSSGPDT